MSDQYGPQGWQPPTGGNPPGGWQPAPGQGYQPGPAQPGHPQPQAHGYPGQPQPGYPYQGPPQQGPAYGQFPGHPQQPGQAPQPGYPQPAGYGPADGGSPPTGRRSASLVVTVVAVVVALLAGFGVWWFAIRDSDTAAGQASPQQAADTLLMSLNQSDPVGVVDQLAPDEAELFAELSGDVFNQLKRIGVLDQSADVENLTGAEVSVDGLDFAPTPQQITADLAIVEVTGGTISVTTNSADMPWSDKVKDAVGEEVLGGGSRTETLDLAELAGDEGHPLRLATVQRDGEWYVSLLYTIADNAAYAEHEGYRADPAAALAGGVPAQGAASPEATMDAALAAVMAGDLRAMIALADPKEMAVLHDYGALLVEAAGPHGLGSFGPGIEVVDAEWVTSSVTGGVEVSVAALTLRSEGMTVSLTVDAAAGTITMDNGQQTETLSVDDLMTQGFGGDVPPQLQDLLKRLAQKVMGLGVVMTEVDGQWYVSPARSFTNVFVTILEAVEPADVDFLIDLATN